MGNLCDPSKLGLDEIEAIEKLTQRYLVQSVVDFGFDAADIFYHSTDDVKDVAEDITREMLDRIGGYQLQQRIYGNVDYRKARYIILPEMCVRQALFVDSKAEKDHRTATLQMSQTSMRIRQMRGDQRIDEKGKLPTISSYQGNDYLTTTMLAHYEYAEDSKGKRVLEQIVLAAVPNGRLQDRYNPTADDTFWLVGRNAPTLGEDFRVRLGFSRLEAKARWRVQRVSFYQKARRIAFEWEE